MFHKPTLTFKNFNNHFITQILTHITNNKPITILTTTSNNTKTTITHTFYNLPNIKIIILYPQNKINPLQKKLFYTLNNNIKTITINNNFNTYQTLIKQTFNNKKLKITLKLNSTNSININHLLTQIYYYFKTITQLPQKTHNQLIISIPNKNFNNLTTNLLTKSLNLPIKHFITTTNINNTIPHFLHNNQ